MIGDAGLLTALHDHGYVINDTNPDYVVVGEGRLINFEVLAKALNLIMKELILDPNCPIDGGIQPGCDSILAFLETASKRKALSLGNPIQS